MIVQLIKGVGNMKYREYFASANTSGGFKSYFDTVFSHDSLERLFVIKGGPGSGKSTLMKRAVSYFLSLGVDTEAFLCSADPESLDGVIFGSKVAIVDGTSPHATDPMLPGAFEEIVDLTKFINVKDAELRRARLVELEGVKKACYRRAYAFMSSAAEIKREIAKSATGWLSYGKMYSAVERYMKQNRWSADTLQGGVRLIDGIGSKGFVHLDTFKDLSKNICYAVNTHGCEGALMDCFIECACERSVSAVKSPDLFLQGAVSGALFPSVGTAVVTACESDDLYADGVRVFNMERFLNRESLKNDRARMKRAKKCVSALVGSALESFHDAGLAHAEIESLYRPCIDYGEVEGAGEEVIRRISQIL
jgi:hypothetical protein